MVERDDQLARRWTVCIRVARGIQCYALVVRTMRQFVKHVAGYLAGGDGAPRRELLDGGNLRVLTNAVRKPDPMWMPLAFQRFGNGIAAVKQVALDGGCTLDRWPTP
jgi:hypothetical protein